ncbi:MAG TPA: PASTA domain-containing protein, partial [Myxococcota bacterium]
PATRSAAAGAGGARADDRVLVPDLLGLSIAEVVERTGRTALELELTGYGRAVTQEPVPGTIVSASRERVRVRFEPVGGRSG